MLPPLAFAPCLVKRVWGGRRLGSVLGKDLPDDAPYGESWEMSAHPSQPGRVAGGPLEGKSIADLREEFGAEFMGTAINDIEGFPLLFKFIDAADVLSVQVHPDDDYARKNEGQMGKTESWYVLAAAPGAKIYHGLADGCTREQFFQKLDEGKLVECLRQVEAQPGDCLHQPAGTVHAIGAGVLLAEIQESSDVTYRVFDWNRVGMDGKPRELHVDKARDVIDFSPDGPNFQPARVDRTPTDIPGIPEAATLVDDVHFRFERLPISGDVTLQSDPERFWMLAVADGTGRLRGTDTDIPLSTGSTILVPATAGEMQITDADNLVLLRMYVPGRPHAA